eukprot:437120-Rhodomonas_salina.1
MKRLTQGARRADGHDRTLEVQDGSHPSTGGPVDACITHAVLAVASQPQPLSQLLLIIVSGTERSGRQRVRVWCVESTVGHLTPSGWSMLGWESDGAAKSAAEDGALCPTDRCRSWCCGVK